MVLLAAGCGSTPTRPEPGPDAEPAVLRAQERVGKGAPVRISYFRFRRDAGGGTIDEYVVLQSVTYTWHRGTPPLDVTSAHFEPDMGATVPDDAMADLWGQIQAHGLADLPAFDPLTIPPAALAQRTLDGTLLTIHAPGVHKSVFLPDSERGGHGALDRFFEWLEPGLWYLRMRYAAKVTEAIHDNDRPFESPLRH